jgi:DNA polymerase/3'-5' exonuclease PolX
MATQADPKELDVQEQIVRIRKHLAEIDKTQAEIRKLVVDAEKTSLDIRIAPWQPVLGGVAAGGALLAAGAALAKLFL